LKKQMLREFTRLLRLMHGQQLIGHHFNPEYTELLLHFEDFVLVIDLPRWTVKTAVVVERIPWKR